MLEEDKFPDFDLSQWKLIFQGAESRVYSGQYKTQPSILKERFKKKYRLPELDQKLTKERTRAEVKAYEKIIKKSTELAAWMPEILFSNERTIVFSEVTDSCNLSQFINENGVTKPELVNKVIIQLGVVVGKIHKCGIVHGDLTTSNFLIKSPSEKVIPIDFGLSISSTADEDRAVDLYVLERAIESTHPNIYFNIFLEAYQNEMGTDKINKRLELVRSRGRKRLAIG